MSLEIIHKCKSLWKTDVCISVGHSPEYFVGLLRCKILITEEWLAQPCVAWESSEAAQLCLSQWEQQQHPFHSQENRAPSRGVSLDAPRVSGQAGTQPPDSRFRALSCLRAAPTPRVCSVGTHGAGLWRAGGRSGLHGAPGPLRTGPGCQARDPAARAPASPPGHWTITALTRLL